MTKKGKILQPSRRQFIKATGSIAAASAFSGMPGGSFSKRILSPFLRTGSTPRKFIILGMDGMDPGLVRRFVEEGGLPTFAKLMRTSHFGKLRTTMPPLSPVAWSSFITGTNPGGHGIFDFVHRNAATFTPYLSTSTSHSSQSALNLGAWSLPLGSGSMELMRRGEPFWNYLNKRDIPTFVHQIPANFPVVASPNRAVSGMGTPDLLGTYGTFTYFSESYVPGSDEFNSGRVVNLKPEANVAKGLLGGPKNPFRNDGRDSAIEVTFVRDPAEKLVKISLQDKVLLIKEGEWTDWVPVQFDYVPHLASSAGMVRFYAKEVHPKLKIYCSPINIDPMDPALPIDSPPGHSADIANATGRFYTQGLPADTKALSLGVLSDEEFYSQAKLILEESMRSLEYGLKNFKEGVFFFYFSSIDQCSHMLMRAMDPNHPQYNPNASPEIKNAIRTLYQRMDDALAMTMPYVDNQTAFMAISDHGFSKFYREFHLATWLVQQGFTVLTHPEKMEQSNFFDYVDWSKTKAYALGFNGIYINRKGRERFGWVGDEEAEAVKRQIIERLPQARDPQNGKPIIVQAYDSKKIYSGPFMSLSPDVLVGYQEGYRISDESVLGKFKREIVGDRVDKWSADHCIDHTVVPGMVLMNRESLFDDPALWDFAPTILRSMSIDVPSTMTGRPLFA